MKVLYRLSVTAYQGFPTRHQRVWLWNAMVALSRSAETVTVQPSNSKCIVGGKYALHAGSPKSGCRQVVRSCGSAFLEKKPNGVIKECTSQHVRPSRMPTPSSSIMPGFCGRGNGHKAALCPLSGSPAPPGMCTRDFWGTMLMIELPVRLLRVRASSSGTSSHKLSQSSSSRKSPSRRSILGLHYTFTHAYNAGQRTQICLESPDTPAALRRPRHGPGPSTPGPGSAWAAQSPRDAAALTCLAPKEFWALRARITLV